MRTAIFVYQPTSITITTSELDLEICGMSAPTKTLYTGTHQVAFSPGVYKIDSSQCLGLPSGSHPEYELATATKTNDPKLTATPRATATFGGSALNDFLGTADAKQIASP
jgi:hypothetical protein